MMYAKERERENTQVKERERGKKMRLTKQQILSSVVDQVKERGSFVTTKAL
jgi:hypothetical protein